MADDLGYSDIGAFGSEIHTPNIDRLSQQGVTFTQFYNIAKCSETRASLLTGLYHQQTENLDRPDNNLTLAEMLQQSGYETILSGKWHLGNWRNEEDTPIQRGFDHFFGFLGGAINFYTGEDWGTGKNYMRLGSEEYQVPENFYATDAFTDYAIERVNKATEREKPFFLYLAYNAPHFPLQVPADEIEPYLETYKEGWDHVRRRRYSKLQDLGFIKPSWELTERDTLVPGWDALTDSQKREEQQLMATYAGMVDRMDQQVGRLLEKVEELDISENTIIMFLSDNGGCPFDFNRTPGKKAGPYDALRSYNVEWANVSNTPFQKYKQWMHEGGISTPLIISWPSHLEKGKIVNTPAHVVDLVPTVIDLVGMESTRQEEQSDLLALEGESLTTLMGDSNEWVNRSLYWEFQGSRAVRLDRWKLVAERGGPWELYDMQTDRTETKNIANLYESKVDSMARLYDRWAERVGAIPDSVARNMPVNRRSAFTFGK